MTLMRRTLLAAALILSAAAPLPVVAQSVTLTPGPEFSGTYALDKSHASLGFRIDHLGLSRYTARFTRFDATLTLDAAQPERSSLTASVDLSSIETDFPEPERVDFDAKLQGADWLNVAANPRAEFRSTRIERTGDRTAKVTGDLSFRGVTQPLTLDVTFNGGYPRLREENDGRLGFSATGTVMRSAHGFSGGIPAAGSTMGLGDAVELQIEVEFIRQP